ncbi:MAG TPA: ATP-grasp domain-containing protein [Thermoclostridium sp.]|nr:ATP-grasp domain-containing protein [Thermoclostridium sp.]
MKKILLLGGSRYLVPVIEAIHGLGYYAITCDYLPDNIAHKYSDEYHNLSIIEKDEILTLARKLKIDGIMSFATDPGVVTAAYVAEELGLPSVGSYEAVSILQNKELFRQYLADHDFNVPKAKGYSNVEDALMDANSFQWPVIVKPVDSAGSKGVTRSDKVDDLPFAVEYAMQFSKTDRVIIEEFIQQQGFSSDSDYFSIDGKLAFASFDDQRFDENAANPHTPSAYSWPSTMPAGILDELRSELQRLITLLNLKTSLYNIETRQGTDGKGYIMEVSPRGGGNRLAEILHYASGVDLVTNAVRAAVGDEIIGIDGDPVYNGNWSIVILHSDGDGIFKNLRIDKSILSCVIEEDLWVKPGDEVRSFTGANEAIGSLVLRFDSEDQLRDVMNNVPEYIRVNIK